jgi:tRNA-splicing endonuclease subunit Sen34
MSESFAPISEPIPIPKIAGRYLLFDVNVVTYLRSTYHICGVLIGSIPQIPQQNVFLGLPLELMPEEAKLLVEKEVAYIVDDVAWHKERFNTLEGSDKKKYLESLRSKGLEARRIAEGVSRKKSENALAKQAAQRRRKAVEASAEDHNTNEDTTDGAASESLFNDVRPASRASSAPSTSDTPFPVTPTTSYSPSSLPENPTPQADPPVPSSYPLFKHLHSRNYFVMPGLRFGCDYNVYPGDPLRFHSHFSATSYDWDEEFSMIDLIGGGRLGTRVKKAFLIGGKDPCVEPDKGGSVRTFCIEWGGM